MSFFQKLKENNNTQTEIPKDAVLIGATLEVLRELREKLDGLYLKIDRLEKTINDKIPEKALSESTFKQEIVDSNEVVNKIISEIKAVTRPIIASKEKLTIVEQKRIEKIISLLQEHGKLSSSQLAQILGLSRTRCNEYFKQMEDLGLVEGAEIGKEKFYKLKD
ncbi:MAG: winged helix-turn-helix domain-containing protein [Candidatus Aenigmatarchaeota archaeon]